MGEDDSDDSLSSLSEGTKAECRTAWAVYHWGRIVLPVSTLSGRNVHRWGQIVLHLKNVHRWGQIVLHLLQPVPLWISYLAWRRGLADGETGEPEKGPGSPGSE